MKIFVNVKTRSRQEKIEKIGENNYIVWVKAAPIEGEANSEVIRVLANYLKSAPSTIVLKSGARNTHKTFFVYK